jgi:O-antigen/teichoic acid export membrane protein
MTGCGQENSMGSGVEAEAAGLPGALAQGGADQASGKVYQEIKRRALHYLQGDLASKVVSMLAVLFVGAVASKEDIGTFSLMVFVAEMTAIVISFGADAAVIKFYRELSAGEVFSNYVLQNGLNAIIAAAGLYGAGLIFRTGTYAFILKEFFTIYSLAVLITVSNVTRAHLVSLGESVKVKWFSMTSGVLNLLCIMALASLTAVSVRSLFFARMVGLALFAFFFAYLVFRYLDRSTWSRALMARMYRYTVPLLIASLVGTVSLYQSRLVLAQYISPYELGIYSFFVMVITNASFLLHSFNQAWTPFLFDVYHAGGDEALAEKVDAVLVRTLKVLLAYTALTVVAYLASNFVTMELKGYYKYRHLFLIMADGPVFGVLYILINPLIYIKSRTRYVAYLSAIILALNILVTAGCIKAWGIFGAAVSSVAVALISFFLYLNFSERAMQRPSLVTARSRGYLLLILGTMIGKYLLFYRMAGAGGHP